MQIRLRKGLDIRLSGTPEQIVERGSTIHSVALIGGDYNGLKPKLAVQEDERVRLGQPLFFDKRDRQIAFTAPGSGRVRAIVRGRRRALLAVVIELEDDATEAPEVAPTGGGDSAGDPGLRERLLRSGLWTAFRTRPFSRIPLSGARPHSIFVTAIDTHPLAADPAVIVAADPDAFATGIDTLRHLTAGEVFVCTGPGWPMPVNDAARVRHVEFVGPHPAGLVGTHIHHLDPVSVRHEVWHIGYQDVIAIGRLIGDGRLSFARTVALGGAACKRPRLLATRIGAALEDLLRDELHATATAQRIVSGSVLAGRSAAADTAYLGRYHQQISVVEEGGERRLFGWLRACTGMSRSLSPYGPSRPDGRSTAYTTALNGRRSALVPVDAFEKVLPLDILPVPLVRSLLVGDTDQAQALGCLELDPEDLALMSFVCPGKNDFGEVLRVNLERIERFG